MKKLALFVTLIIGLLLASALWPESKGRQTPASGPELTSEPDRAEIREPLEQGSRELDRPTETLATTPEETTPLAIPTVLLTGQVLHDSLPATGAEVWVYAGHDLSSQSAPPEATRVRCDATGGFRIAAPWGSSLIATKNGMSATEFVYLETSGRAGTKLASDIEGLELTLWDLREVGGQVRDSNGANVQGADVWTSPAEGSSSWRTTQDLRCSYRLLADRKWLSDMHGQFRGKLPDCGAWNFHALRGRRKGHTWVERLGANTVEILLASPSGADTKLLLFGTVDDSLGRPVPHAKVGYLGHQTMTNQQGEWSFLVHPRETLSVVRAAGYRTTVARREIQTLLWDTGPIELSVTQGVSIRGALFDANGKSLPDQIIRIEGEQEVAKYSNQPQTELSLFGRSFRVTDKQGQFEFTGLEPREYRLAYVQEEPGGLAIATVTAPAEGVRLVLGEVDFDGVRFRGVVRDAITSEPIEGARVSASRLDELDISGESRNGVRSAKSDARGEFDLRGLDEGDYDVSANSPGYASTEIEFGKTRLGTHDLTLELLPERSLHVLVLDPSGEPVSGVRIRALDLTGESRLIRRSSGLSASTVSTDKHGGAYLHGLPAAQLSLGAKAHHTQPTTTSEVDLRADGEHQATIQLDFYPFPSSGTRTVRMHLRFSNPEKQSALQRLDLHVFDDKQRPLAHPRFDLIEGEWTTTAPVHWVQRVEREEEQLTVFVIVPKDSCQIRIDVPGRSSIIVEVPESLETEALVVDL